jgi:hypothetical protein
MATEPTLGDVEETLVGDEEAAVRRIEAVSKLLDDAFRVPGTDFRFGLDPLVGVLPVAGDSTMALVSLYIVLEAINLGVSRGVVARMLLNIGLDTVIGSIPILGTLFDASWKANRRNARLVERHLGLEFDAAQ